MKVGDKVLVIEAGDIKAPEASKFGTIIEFGSTTEQWVLVRINRTFPQDNWYRPDNLEILPGQ